MLVTKFGLYTLLSSRKLPTLMSVLMEVDGWWYFFLARNSRHGRKLDMFSTKVCMGIAKKAIGCPWLVFGTRKWVVNMKPGCKPKRIHSSAPNTLFSVKRWRFATLLDSEEFPAADETGNYTHSFSDNRYHGHSMWSHKSPVDGHSCGRKHLIFLKSIIFFSFILIEIYLINAFISHFSPRFFLSFFPGRDYLWPTSNGCIWT